MQLISTHKALDELSNRQHQFSPRQRAVLLLANGQRSQAELRALVGDEVTSDIEQLLALGLLAPVQASEPLPHDPPRSNAPEGGRLAALAQTTRLYLNQVAVSLTPLKPASV